MAVVGRSLNPMSEREALQLCLKVMSPFERAFTEYKYITVGEMEAVAKAMWKIKNELEPKQ